MTKVKVFVYGRQRQQRRHRRRRLGYDNSSPDFRHGELKIKDGRTDNLQCVITIVHMSLRFRCTKSHIFSGSKVKDKVIFLKLGQTPPGQNYGTMRKGFSYPHMKYKIPISPISKVHVMVMFKPFEK